MRNKIKIHTCALTFVVSIAFAGCSYLDVDPELGISENEVFETYANFRSYFDWVYQSADGTNSERIHLTFPLYYDMTNYYSFAWVTSTDAADTGLLGIAQNNFKKCNLSQEILENYTFSKKSVCYACFHIIRKCNITIANIDRCKDATQKEYNDLLGQAYFLRGFCHYTLCRLFGGMPYIDYVIGTEDEWDLARLSSYETFIRAAEDMYTGYEYLKLANYMRRDAMPGQQGHLEGKTLLQPGGVAALALRSRTLLYAASPLSNMKGTSDWEAAALAAAEALQASKDYGYDLLPASNYTDNFKNRMANNESIWFWSHNEIDKGSGNFHGLLSTPQSGWLKASGVNPTQNFVDKFETIDGYALNTEADRSAAAAAGAYNEQNPYANRDPRFDVCVVYDRQINKYWADGMINLYYDPATGRYAGNRYNGNSLIWAQDWGTTDNSRGLSNTGYYCNKFWCGKPGDYNPNPYYRIDPLIRVAELYLNYAEAVNEAYGPMGTAPGCDMTAVDAINVVRARIGMPPVRAEYTSDKDRFRERIHNERNVELAFEGNHYYFDIRRWKTAPESMTQTLYGMRVTKVPVSAEYPVGRMYERKAIPQNRQSIWKDCMYYIPFPNSQAYKMKNFVNNPAWN